MLILALSLCSLLTALLSGVFGMAGGMLLMGAYTAFLPVPTAMVLHGGTQLVSNVTRAILLRRFVYWRGFARYVFGALLAFAALLTVHYVPDPLVVFLGLGLTPFLARLVPPRWIDFQRPGAAFVCGIQVAAVQLLAGAAGPLLDVAFLDTKLTRHEVVATKAATQVFSHVLKVVYFVPAMTSGAISPALAACILSATIAGTRVGTYVLERMSDDSFRRYSRRLIYAIGCVYLCKAGLYAL
ncbi:MAG TPA: sulfite exporter TauE/SafE family protein [Polyangiales bacterium]|nr:sulfite exporter TauE/SafE family protein [Polyangiales bacterium]